MITFPWTGRTNASAIRLLPTEPSFPSKRKSTAADVPHLQLQALCRITYDPLVTVEKKENT